MNDEELARTPRHRDESGATLIFTFAYLFLIGITVSLLSLWIANDASNAAKFAASDAKETAYSNAVSVAIQSIRYTPLVGAGQTLNASPPSYCWGSSSPSSLSDASGNSVSVWCSTALNSFSTATRVVTIDACASSMSAAACAASPQLVAVVTFDDYPSSQPPDGSSCTTTCGAGVTMTSYTWKGSY